MDLFRGEGKSIFQNEDPGEEIEEEEGMCILLQMRI